MKNRLRVLCAVLLLRGLCFGQGDTRPFASVDDAFKRGRHRSSELSAPFQAVRTQLGTEFEPELWKYLGDDLDKQDRVANFLTYSGYLHGNLPMPDLALKIHLKSIALVKGKTELSSRIAFVTASINAAVESAELELADEARLHKSDAERMLAADKFMVAGAPAMDDYDGCVYDTIGDAKVAASPAVACLAKKAAGDAKVTMIEVGEIAKEKIVSRPEPRWLKGTKAGSGADGVKVLVVVDESGKVESAEALGERSALSDAALAAARKARFQPTMYQGSQVKVRGWLAY